MQLRPFASLEESMNIFKKATSVFQQKVSNVAAQMNQYLQGKPDREVFLEIWADVERFYKHEIPKIGMDSPKLQSKELLKQTGMPQHLSTMFELLEKEDRQQMEKGVDDTGPCMEAMLEEEVVAKLCSYAGMDVPPGTRILVLAFLTDLIETLHQPIISIMSVCKPLGQLMDKLLAEGEGKNIRGKLFSLLNSICGRLAQNPPLLSFYFRERLSDSKDLIPFTRPNGEEAVAYQFPMFQALINLMNKDAVGKDTQGGDKARLSIVRVIEIKDTTLAAYIVEQTNFCAEVVSELVKKYYALKQTMASLPNLGVVDPNDSSLVLQAEAEFDERMLYINALCEVCNEYVALGIVRVIESKLFEPEIGPSLVFAADKEAELATSRLVKILSLVENPLIKTSVVSFLLGPELVVETPDSSDGIPPIRSQLMKRINHEVPAISKATMRLFDALLALHQPEVLTKLVLNQLSKQPTHVDIVEAFNMDSSLTRFFECCPALFGGEDDVDIYLEDAQHGVANAFYGYQEWFDEDFVDAQISGLEDEHVDVEDSESAAANVDESAQQGFYEGAFLEQIMKKFTTFFENTVEENLVLTSILVHLCQCPQSLLQAYMMTTEAIPGAKMPPFLTLLAQLWESVRTHIEGDDGFVDRFESVREQLVEDEDDDSAETDEKKFVRNFVVLNEFRKEIEATIRAKQQFEQLKQLAAEAENEVTDVEDDTAGTAAAGEDATGEADGDVEGDE